MSYFLSLVFYLFSQAAPLGLVVLIAVAAPEHLRKGTMTSIGVSIAWLIDFAAFTYAVSHSAPKVQLMATPVAIVFTLACIYTRKLSAPRPVVAGDQEKGLQ